MINWFLSQGQTDSLTHEKKLALGITTCIVVNKVAFTFYLISYVNKDYTFRS